MWTGEKEDSKERQGIAQYTGEHNSYWSSILSNIQKKTDIKAI